MSGPAYETIAVDTHASARWITLSRPRVHNAMNSLCIRECRQAVEEAGADPAVRSIVFTGAGDRAFTAGADISEMVAYGPNEMLLYNRGWLGLFRDIEMCRKPVIAAVHGWATGGGTELSLACDFVLCTDAARFGLAEINIGVIPGAGAAVRLTRWVGRLKAKELLMLGRLVEGREAVELHLANRCVPPDELRDAAQALADELGAKAPLALGAAKASVNVGADSGFDAALEYELQEFLRLFATADQKEGMRAFLEKRNPIYHGM
ncbi:enoyl-CoA hydratase/isomerase family protein [Azospirillum canadense]|uniref:enoyl-CoA hydratase/isomerase family protein n=1 Tax=Azospirillum canadense TaxID=403962 RepID=UPI0022272C51|nr:enoyl-CoA hydratase/isomerase family protein [Azospirillum canadense]MCW2241364.1 enoyl-CoA hydratase/carnithine racemase [Azospirillum canadense]